MQELRDRTAVVTGAASGIGRALALRAADEGMSVAAGDVDEAGLASLGAELESRGARCCIRRTDVSREDDVCALADAAESELGRVRLVFNNAGVLVGGYSWERSREDWEWVLGVNLWGVIHGVRVFVPRLLECGEAAHVVNTASIGGLLAGPMLAPYIASKHAVISLSESLARELADLGSSVGVSVLCPGATDTGITDSGRVRPERLGEPAPPTHPAEQEFMDGVRHGIADGTSPDRVAEAALSAVRSGQFWVFSDASLRALVEARQRSILDAF